ncbi:MFS transporter [Bacillus lacus]|uniref:MFS transporter n=1 Tax=Metabacillus lacus TaxID=1983721 RepID=A0A7X2IYZ4_9BACI|nr:MFS transporter [Metabacillus lacus]MRX72375.1 MFS transporter [Metabacillus lacus]
MPKALWLLIIGMMINVTGSSFLWPLNTIYIHEYLGKSLTVAGAVLMLNSAASVAGNLFGGVLFDKIGGYKSILLGIFITLFAVIGLVFFHDWGPYVLLLTIVGFGSGIVFPSMYAMAGSVWPEGGRRAFNSIYVAQNVGVAVGAALGGLIASYSFQLIFTANAVLYIVFLLVAVFGFKGMDTLRAAAAPVLNGARALQQRYQFRALMIVCSGYLLCWVAYVQWQSTISVHTKALGIPISHYSLLWAVNGALIVFAQPLISLVVKYAVKTLKQQMIFGILIFIISFIVASTAQQFSGFLAAMVILTVGEMLVWPAVPTIANNLAPKGKEGFYQGFVNSTATGGRMIGPLLGGILVDIYGMSMMFLVLSLLLFSSIGFVAMYDKRMKAAQEEKVAVSS